MDPRGDALQGTNTQIKGAVAATTQLKWIVGASPVGVARGWLISGIFSGDAKQPLNSTA